MFINQLKEMVAQAMRPIPHLNNYRYIMNGLAVEHDRVQREHSEEQQQVYIRMARLILAVNAAALKRGEITGYDPHEEFEKVFGPEPRV